MMKKKVAKKVEAKPGNRRFHICDGKRQSLTEWAKELGVSRERMRVMVNKYKITEAVRRLTRSDEEKAEDRLDAAREGMDRRIGTVTKGWRLLEYRPDNRRLIACAKCKTERDVYESQFPRCWTCKPRKT